MACSQNSQSGCVLRLEGGLEDRYTSEAQGGAPIPEVPLRVLRPNRRMRCSLHFGEVTLSCERKDHRGPIEVPDLREISSCPSYRSRELEGANRLYGVPLSAGIRSLPEVPGLPLGVVLRPVHLLGEVERRTMRGDHRQAENHRLAELLEHRRRNRCYGGYASMVLGHLRPPQG